MWCLLPRANRCALNRGSLLTRKEWSKLGMNRRKAQERDPAFMNLSLDEMSARIAARDQQLTRRNGVLVLVFLGLLLISALFAFYFYGAWMAETLGAAWQVGAAVRRWEWWQALTIAFQYKLSFFILGIVIGFFVFLFVTFQIGEWIVETAWDWLNALWN